MTAPTDWGPWEPIPANTSPYVDVWQSLNSGPVREDGTRAVTAEAFDIGATREWTAQPEMFDWLSGYDFSDFHAAEREKWIAFGDHGQLVYSRVAGGAKTPIPARSVSDGWAGFDKRTWADLGIIGDKLPPADDIDDDTVIIGVIDTGIPLGTRRTQFWDEHHGDAGGFRTRILAAWQQTATWAGGNQDYLPFGREIYTADIERHLRQHSTGQGAQARLDEDAFNLETRTVERIEDTGHRDLDYRAAHGAHILDLAAGQDPFADPDMLARARIIVVNLPPQALHGTAGNFLEIYASFAVERIVSLADALWLKKNPSETPGEGRGKGFPIAINFSYGMQAGPKDGSTLFEDVVEKIRDHRTISALMAGGHVASPICISTPMGNHNVDRAHAELTLTTEQPSPPLAWRICPSDQTPNFLEIWADTGARPRDIETGDLALTITPPGMAAMPLGALQAGSHRKLGDFAWVYVQREHKGRGPAGAFRPLRHRLRVLIATAPTLDYRRRGSVAPSGVWKIDLATTGPTLHCTLDVQSDQAEVIHSFTSLKSYFDDAAYQRHESTGRVKDSFAYTHGAGPAGLPTGDLEAGEGPVQRQGTRNAIATNGSVLAIAGYRQTDGRPATYSSSGKAHADPFSGTQTPDAAYPTDDGAAHYGILAAGARDGSVVAYRGTSMAAALVTRDVAAALASWRNDAGWTPKTWIASHAARRTPPGLPAAAPEKVGAGRIPYPDDYRTGPHRRFPRYD